MTMADRIVVMKDGYIQQVGTPYELYFKPVNMFVAGFIGEPPMNFVSSVVTNGRIRIGNKEFELKEVLSANTVAAYEGKKLVLGFRPEGTVLGAQENSFVMSAEVELTELLGDNTNVYVDMDGVKSILKVDPHDTPKMDTAITFSIPYKNAYFFDGETEVVINERKDA
jgi:multiple sugar transport system ATP-binding protein